MEARLFTLVNAEDSSQVFAVGMEIEDEEQREAVIYRREDNGHSMIGKHTSAESALQRFNTLAPMDLVWAEEETIDLDTLFESMRN
jgi:hypothetical protein